MLTFGVKKVVRYLRNIRAVSALEYAVVVGIVATGLSAAYVTFKSSIGEAVAALARQLSGAS